MERDIEQRLARWRDEGLLDEATAARIAAWEKTRSPGTAGRLGRFAFGFGGLLLAAGILLFVAANWPLLAPVWRVVLLAATVALLHVGAGLASPRSGALATTLHAVGTAAFGAGIFLSGQAFHLEEYWSTGLLLWALGAAAALYWLHDWPHVVWVAVLAPAWLVLEWVRGAWSWPPAHTIVAVGLFLLATAYLAAEGARDDSAWRRALARLGALMIVPASLQLALAPLRLGEIDGSAAAAAAAPWMSTAWILALGLPLMVGFWLRGREAWTLLVAVAFALAVVFIERTTPPQQLAAYALFAAASVGIVAWGVRDGHRLRVNVGVLGFALTVLWFYFASVFDKLGRSFGLIVLGVVFLGGGWWLERARRRLVERIGRASA